MKNQSKLSKAHTIAENISLWGRLNRAGGSGVSVPKGQGWTFSGYQMRKVLFEEK